MNSFDEAWLADYQTRHARPSCVSGAASSDPEKPNSDPIADKVSEILRQSLREPGLNEIAALMKIGAEMATPKPKAPPAHPEWDFQTTVAEFLDLALPAEAFWSSVDMGPARSKAVGGLRKARGLRSGIPDLIIVYQRITVWVECKTSTGTLSQAQKNVRLALLANGHHWALARTLDDVTQACAAVGIPLRGVA